MSDSTHIRNGGRWRKLRARFAAQRQPCHICGYPIGWGADWLDPSAYQLDHVNPKSVTGERGYYDPSNLAASHRFCNRRKWHRALTPRLRAEIKAAYEREVLHKQPTQPRKQPAASETPQRSSRRWI